MPLFEAHAAGRLRFAITTITIAEVLTGPMKTGDEALARRYRAILESWRPVAIDVDIAESAARLRAALRLGLADAVQAASALAINAAALVTHDRDFSRVCAFYFDGRSATRLHRARIASSRSATMLVFLIAGLTAGPAVSL